MSQRTPPHPIFLSYLLYPTLSYLPRLPNLLCLLPNLLYLLPNLLYLL